MNFKDALHNQILSMETELEGKCLEFIELYRTKATSDPTFASKLKNRLDSDPVRYLDSQIERYYNSKSKNRAKVGLLLELCRKLYRIE